MEICCYLQINQITEIDWYLSEINQIIIIDWYLLEVNTFPNVYFKVTWNQSNKTEWILLHQKWVKVSYLTTLL